MRYRRAFAFLLVSAVWGASFPAIRAGVQVVPPVLFAAIRFDLTALLVLGYALARGYRLRPTRGDVPGILAGGVFLVGLHNALLFVGQQHVTSAVAAVIVATVPVLTAGLALLLLPSTGLGRVGVVGLVLGFVGAAIVADPDPATLGAADSVGAGLVLLSALALALATVLVQRTRSDLSAAALQGWMMFVGGLSLHVGSLLVGEPQTAEWTVGAVLALGYLVPVAGGLGYLLYVVLLDELGSVEINLVSYVNPLFAALVGWLVLGEAVEATTAVGFLVIVVGFALVKRRALARLSSRHLG